MPFINPLSEQLYIQKRKDIVSHFPFLEGKPYVLSCERYFASIPQKFYDKEAFSDFLNFLNKVKAKHPLILANILIEKEDRLSLAIANLEMINERPIHDLKLPKDYYLSLFLNEHILFDLLKLWEGPFFELLYLVAVVSREERGKPHNLELYDVIEELRFLPTSFGDFLKYKDLFENTIRNGIGHGKIDFMERRTKFTDKKNNSVDKSNDVIVSLFDDLLDTLNGFCFALKVFYFANKEFLNSKKVNIPISIMLQELTSGASTFKWEIKSCLESTVQGRNQLNIFIDTKLRDITILRSNIFHSGILASELTNKYDIICLQIRNGLGGLAMFDANKVRQINLSHTNPKLEDYVREAYYKKSELLFFAKSNSLNILRKIITMLYIGQILLPIYFRPFYRKYRRKFEVISTYIHSKKWYNVVEASIVLDLTKVGDARMFVKKKYNYIIKKVINESKSDKSLFSRIKLLPARFVTVQIYMDNVRVREGRISKMKGKKICSLRLNNTSNIKIANPFPEHTDTIGNYTILWSSYLDEVAF